jgi:protein TonB
VQCVVGAGGKPERCRVLDESPAEYGFGEAAVAMAERFFRYPPKDGQGRPTAGRPVMLPIHFLLAD